MNLFKTDNEAANAANAANQPGQITCPFCFVEHKFKSKNDIYQLIKNWAVLQYAETFAK